ncbi:zinc-binding protein A33-like [Ambystoma mexicanum]|uniref:zinc-binding protein A33-like n=1 Tax=Ambystoma mexicanum TaxID=8296 RepID=UPI0037E87603
MFGTKTRSSVPASAQVSLASRLSQRESSPASPCPQPAMAGLAPAEDGIAQELSCPICHEIFREPVVLECSHDFCQECIDRYWASVDVCTCPMCKREHPDRKYTPVRTLGRLADTHREKEAAADAAGRQMLFCTEDGVLVPGHAAYSPEHSKHVLLPLQQAASFYREKMTSTVAALECSLQGLRSMRQQQEEKVPETKAQYISLEEQICQEFSLLHRWLQEREVALMKELKREEEMLLEALNANVHSLKEAIRAVDEKAELIRNHLQKQDPTDLLTDLSSLIAKYCTEESTQRSPDIHLTTANLCQGRFRGPIQYAVWKEMKNAIQPFPSQVTFDPKTSHPRLILSKDLTSMSVGDPEEEVQDHPLRFSKSGCVLGSLAISSGRHYWEVAVANKTSWDIGVAKVSVDRKRIIKLKPENGYWTIWLRNGHEYKALDTPSKSLTLKGPPQKIGVYLDYEAGQVSFYNAEDMSHIYTFKDTFTEVLYPMFGPGVNDGTYNEPVRILHLKL